MLFRSTLPLTGSMPILPKTSARYSSVSTTLERAFSITKAASSKFLFVTLFPEQIEQAANHSIIQRAVNKGLVEISCINPREFTHDVHRTVDDTPFGGGAGMVLKPEPMVAAIRKAKEQLPNARVIAMCPGGRTLKQSIVEEYAHCGQDFIFVCGHYEGFDERIFNWVDEKL